MRKFHRDFSSCALLPIKLELKSRKVDVLTLNLCLCIDYRLMLMCHISTYADEFKLVRCRLSTRVDVLTADFTLFKRNTWAADKATI